MDVTDQIVNNHLTYGSSDNTNASGLSASRSLNYAKGASIQKPIQELVTIVPYQMRYQDTVGLMGAENAFVRVNLNLLDTGNGCYEETDWLCAIFVNKGDTDADYTTDDLRKDGGDTDTNYDQARWSNDLLLDPTDYVIVELENLKTGNQYIDDWLDIRLYTSQREEHPYNKMYVQAKDFFYIGFHARNTRRLPYDVTCTIGNTFVDRRDLVGDEQRYIMRKN